MAKADTGMSAAEEIAAKRTLLLRQIEELDQQEREQQTAHLTAALKYLDEKKINFDELAKHYRSINGKVIFAIDYLDPTTRTVKTFELREGTRGSITNEMKTILRELGREKVKEGVKDKKDESAVLDRIFKDRQPRSPNGTRR
ncbi:MAG: hypothetical protein EON54_02605 [Alcaligenaceae bacterium]|nr:MAG: hypothetical protein EON54_02605 [Alcaligenaceae bacterium]